MEGIGVIAVEAGVLLECGVTIVKVIDVVANNHRKQNSFAKIDLHLVSLAC